MKELNKYINNGRLEKQLNKIAMEKINKIRDKEKMVELMFVYMNNQLMVKGVNED